MKETAKDRKWKIGKNLFNNNNVLIIDCKIPTTDELDRKMVKKNLQVWKKFHELDY